MKSMSCASGRCSGECTTNPCDKVCVPMPGAGQPCNFECAPGAYCDRTAGTCAPPKIPGPACVNDDECATGLCGHHVRSRRVFAQKLDRALANRLHLRSVQGVAALVLH